MMCWCFAWSLIARKRDFSQCRVVWLRQRIAYGRGIRGVPAGARTEGRSGVGSVRGRARLAGMELRQLRFFLEVAEEMNISAAARKLHITQPALSRQIKALEEDLGWRLIERGSRSISLTPGGRSGGAGGKTDSGGGPRRGLERMRRAVPRGGIAGGLCAVPGAGVPGHCPGSVFAASSKCAGVPAGSDLPRDGGRPGGRITRRDRRGAK